MWCSCYYTFYFNALKRYPIPTPGVGLHNFTPITSVIIGGIPPGGIFWKKNPGLTSTHHCIKACPLFHIVFHMLHIRRNNQIAHQQYCIYPLYTVAHSQSIPPQVAQPLFPFCQTISSSPPSHSFPFTTLSNLSNYFLSLSYIISILFYLYIIFNTISHRPIFFYLIYYIASILYQYNI